MASKSMNWSVSVSLAIGIIALIVSIVEQC
jgi:hypothetical protein